ncbi:ankyrin repeat domain-containing protein [Candidatus Sulfurimonas marisnigri]|uniref:Ankyrin repeat domain-containing protein n=1 Tax=Candidatus Sulfurimonas marisnigri TaxID=2740405 RepID=A0A7S7LYN4_9BACT|nr:ankyrin repeat domain-containing protein [Candidatus Sulfurimonas marisnigri]QOY53812.1 ankyrin repeat domain-containing protein [Candidatus Sulfurimonas marisnigri]
MKLYTILILFYTSLLAVNEFTFTKTNDYINSLDYNNSVKYEMQQLLSATKKVTFNADGQNLMEGLITIRLSDCLEKHITGKHFRKLYEFIFDEIKSSGNEEDYKHGIKNSMEWWLTTIAMKMKVDGNNTNELKDFFLCNSTTNISIPNDISNVRKPKAPILKKYDDPIINFYLNEYKKSYESFINAKSMIDIFRFDVEKDMSMDCMRRSIKLNGNDKWIEEGSQIRKAIRYELTPTATLRKSVRKNEDHMGRKFYLYDLNMVNNIQDDITDLWGGLHTNPCLKKQSSSELYTNFLPKYVKKYTEDLTSSRQRPMKELKKHYIKREEWLKQVTESCNECKPYQTHKERMVSKKKEAEKRLFRMAKKLEPFKGINHLADINTIDSEGKTPLFYAIKLNNLYYLNLFIKAGADIMHKDKYGKTIFDYFDNDVPYRIRNALWMERKKLKNPNFKVEKVLTQYGKKIVYTEKSYTDKDSWTELMHAVYKNDENKVDLLLQNNINVNDYNNNRTTALHMSISLDNLNIMKKLLDKGANVEAKNRYGATPLFFAVSYENKKALKLLLQYGANIHTKNNFKETPLLYAYHQKKASMINYLIKNGSDINERNSNGETILFEAFKNGSFKDVQFFLKLGADISIQNNEKKYVYDYINYRTAEKIVKIMQMAYLKKHLEEKAPVSFVIKYNNNNNNNKNSSKPSPLKHAIVHSDIEKLKILLKIGTNKEVSLIEKNRLLFTAVSKNNIEAINLLLDNGADIEAKNNSERTPLIHALAYRYFDVTKLLVEKGANFKTPIYKGMTPTNIAAKWNLDKELMLFIKDGAYVNIQDTLTERTPLMHTVARCSHPESIQVAKYLLEHNADINIRDKKGLDAIEITEKECHLKAKQELLVLLREHVQSLEDKSK